jgi:drug/metabolite transporter (DMT)-like permease
MWVALSIVYLVWGSTYLAIRVAVQTLPPLLSAGVRFLSAGTLMSAALLLRRGRAVLKVSVSQVAASATIGVALLLGGNGLVTLAEQHVPSGLTALIIASVPLWVVVLRTVTGDRVSKATLAGVAVGFAGVTLLVVPGSRGGHGALLGVALLVIASLSWATGSFFASRLPVPDDPYTASALEMLTGGAIISVLGVVSGEASHLSVASFSSASLVALGYLVVAGSVLAFTAYGWLLQHAPISKVATYAYVNPVIAVVLGWAVLSERLTWTIIVAATVIVSSVAFTVRKESSPIQGKVERAPAVAGAESR